MKYWKYNKCILYNADCITLIKRMISKNIKVDLIYTDPPYKLDRINDGGSINTKKNFNKSLSQLDKYDLISGYDIRSFGSLVQKIQNDINIFFWCNIKQIMII